METVKECTVSGYNRVIVVFCQQFQFVKDCFNRNNKRPPTKSDLLTVLLKTHLKYNRLGENANSCRYDRTPPNLNNISSTISDNDRDTYNLYYNIWKNMFEFSVHPDFAAFKKKIENNQGIDLFCCTNAQMIIQLLNGINYEMEKLERKSKSNNIYVAAGYIVGCIIPQLLLAEFCVSQQK